MSIIHQIGAGHADGAVITEIRHAKISFAMGATGLQFFYLGALRRTLGNDIKGYVRDIATHSAEILDQPAENLASKNEDKSPLDLNSETPCYYVIELDDRLNWQFQNDANALSTKTDLSSHYCELRHVSAGVENGPGDGCTVIYFAAVNPPAKHQPGQHPFNLHVEFLQDGGKRLPIIIDPDIRYPGGHPA